MDYPTYHDGVDAEDCNARMTSAWEGRDYSGRNAWGYDKDGYDQDGYDATGRNAHGCFRD